MGQSIMASIRHLLAGFVSLTIVALIQAQTTPPDASNPGCPPPPDPLGNEGKHCFSQGTTCVATKGGYPKQFASGGQVYRIFRTGNWWFCGKACDPHTVQLLDIQTKNPAMLPVEELLLQRKRWLPEWSCWSMSRIEKKLSFFIITNQNRYKRIIKKIC